MRLRSRGALLEVSVSPPMLMVPPLGRISPASIRSVVVLPAPFGPSRAKISPGASSKETSSTATRSPKRRVRCDAVSIDEPRRPRSSRRPRIRIVFVFVDPFVSSWLRPELVAARRDQQAAVGGEEEARRADDAGGGELHRPDLVARDCRRRRCRAPTARSRAALADPRRRRGPRAAPAALRGRPPGASASASAARRDTDPVRVPSMCRSNRKVAVAVVLAEQRPAAEEDVVEPAGRIDERKADVQREVEVAILLEARSRAGGRCCAGQRRQASTR